MKKRIGLLLASIHTGSALNVWTTLASEARRYGGAFFIFPGGKLDSHPDSEYLRNSVYRLINSGNLDGLISWGSSIGGAVSRMELDHFHESLEPLPYVTIAHKMKGHFCISFDAYTGFKSLVSHFITVHGAKRIAFLRGPATHESASDRYRAFVDACEDAGLCGIGDNLLVSSPWPWSSGESAIVELCEKRKLVPGRDFDVLIGSSDMMVFSAVRYLGKAGYRVPADYLVGGFNDSAESRILESAFSTVHLPYRELGLESFRMIRKILASKDGSIELRDIVLPAEMVIRESCGCRISGVNGSEAGPTSAMAGTGNRSPDRLIRDLARLFRLDDTDVNAMLEPIVYAARARDEAVFFDLCERALVRFFEGGMDEGLFERAFSLVRTTTGLDIGWIEDIEKRLYRLMFRVQGRVLSLERYETAKRYATLNSLKCELLEARDRDSLVSVLSVHLPEIGIHTGSVVLQEHDGTSRFVGGFSLAGIEVSSAGTVFPERRLLPESVERNYVEGVFMVQPLFMENRPLGYFICNVPFNDGPMFEDLRSAISSSLKGIFLFEEATRAKQDAESAERAKSEFFASAGNELVDPLRTIAEGLGELEAGLAGVRDQAGTRVDSSIEQVRAIKAQLASQLERTERLIDLTLSGFDGLTFDNRLFRLSELFPDSGIHPLLQGDPARLAEAFKLIGEEYPCIPKIDESVSGLAVSFYREAQPLSKSHGMLLAERIVRLQYADFSCDETSCVIVLLWPNLAGVAPTGFVSHHTIARSNLVRLQSSGGTFPAMEAFGASYSFDGTENDDTVLMWNADGSTGDEIMKVHLLRHHAVLFRSPFICWSSALAGKTLAEAVERTVRTDGKGKILFIGSAVERFDGWADSGSSVTISSMESFRVAVADGTPSLVVFFTIDIDAINAVRRYQPTVLVPVLVLPDRIDVSADIAALGVIPRVVLANRALANDPEFAERVRSILSGDEILPPHTGVLVKKAIQYLNVHATKEITRWKLADSVNVSEDYLTRIFRKETGVSMWEYLSRYRVFLATELLLHTNGTIYEIALATGFQDQAYFCRVFKKITGMPPGKMRNL
jgi:DNA-binding LacI/PurR family transcriptional regulator/AraC-like DNA-binding protein